ncbi:hypothetical protein EF294_07420 [Gordonia oryzae]|uniref:Uncharacterized protein n=1 Tax=Gordonia oryzae TaxID=2487349 RepID=A0A3N4HES8_9ACTN|nr:hypothetical protein [Gordonia oryzae]RPA64904.1 hypothetical protein EF294_07420 [Gordonia oryzae]
MTTTSPNLATDRLIEASRRFASVTDWAVDALSAHDIYSDEYGELELICEYLPPLKTALRAFTHYSDGRPVSSEIEIEVGLVHSQLWPAAPTTMEERLEYESRLPVDPGQPDRGGYRLYVNDLACRMRVEFLPAKPNLVSLP